MALRGSRIENFDKLWCKGASRSLEFCVSSTNFQKNYLRLASTASDRKDLKYQLKIGFLIGGRSKTT
jgi:hypothetical protein